MRPKKSRRAAKPRVPILIVDDHPMMREGLAQLIAHEPDLAVCGQADCARDALQQVAKLQPALALVDISLRDSNGLELVKDLRALHPELAVIVISMHDESIYAERVLRAGGRGYVMKQEGGKKIMQAIRTVLSGQIYVSEKISSRILELYSGRRAVQGTSPIESQSDREFEVFQLIGEGRGTRQIAEQLHLSVKTVEVHRMHIKAKLNIPDAPSLIRYAVRWVEGQNPG